jgi:molecular chaperone DnaJ
MDLYQILGVVPDVTAPLLRRAFQKLARLYHPDLNPGDPVAAARYVAIAQAFEVLSDPARRGAYDRGDPVLTPAQPVLEMGFEGFDFATEVRAEVVGLREIFDAARGPAEREASPSPGEDLQLTTCITFEEAFHGTSRRVQVIRQEQCPECHGAGDAATTPVACPGCAGSGQVRARRGHMVFRRPCGDCGGLGSIRSQTCARCQGEGRLTQSEQIEVTIPAGVGDGSELRVPGGGNVGRRGGAGGDLVLRVEAGAHPLYTREGADLHCVVPITMTEAALGAHIEVPTPDGPMRIEIPAGTQTGQRFRLRGRGMPRVGGKGRGGLFIETRVRVAAVRDERGRELLEELARIHVENPRAQILAEATLRGEAGSNRGAQPGAQEEGDAADTRVIS